MAFLTTSPAGTVTAPNTTADIIDQKIYSDMLLKELDAWLIGRPLFNDRTSEFGHGDDLEITKTVNRTLQAYTENDPVTFAGMDTSRLQLQITEYPFDAFYVTDKLKQDSNKAAAFWLENVRKSIEAFKVKMETDALAAANSSQTPADPNTIAGAAHRISGSGGTGTDGKVAIADFSRMKLAFDKAKVPTEQRLAIVSPEVESQLNQLLNIVEVTSGDVFNKDVTGLVNTGFGDKLNVVRKLMGWNIVISHHLPQVTSEVLDGVTHSDASACVFMSMASADDMPIMGAIRQQPTPEFDRNVTYKRDEWSATARWGFGVQRPEALGILVAANAV